MKRIISCLSVIMIFSLLASCVTVISMAPENEQNENMSVRRDSKTFRITGDQNTVEVVMLDGKEYWCSNQDYITVQNTSNEEKSVYLYFKLYSTAFGLVDVHTLTPIIFKPNENRRIEYSTLICDHSKYWYYDKEKIGVEISDQIPARQSSNDKNSVAMSGNFIQIYGFVESKTAYYNSSPQSVIDDTKLSQVTKSEDGAIYYQTVDNFLFNIAQAENGKVNISVSSKELASQYLTIEISYYDENGNVIDKALVHNMYLASYGTSCNNEASEKEITYSSIKVTKIWTYKCVKALEKKAYTYSGYGVGITSSPQMYVYNEQGVLDIKCANFLKKDIKFVLQCKIKSYETGEIIEFETKEYNLAPYEIASFFALQDFSDRAIPNDGLSYSVISTEIKVIN